jgi:excisionase family DNA binding protein
MSGTDLISPRQAADRLGVSVKTLRAWANAGRLAKVRTLGGHNRYRRVDIEVIRAAADDEGISSDVAS